MNFQKQMTSFEEFRHYLVQLSGIIRTDLLPADESQIWTLKDLVSWWSRRMFKRKLFPNPESRPPEATMEYKVRKYDLTLFYGTISVSNIGFLAWIYLDDTQSVSKIDVSTSLSDKRAIAGDKFYESLTKLFFEKNVPDDSFPIPKWMENLNYDQNPSKSWHENKQDVNDYTDTSQFFEDWGFRPFPCIFGNVWVHDTVFVIEIERPHYFVAMRQKTRVFIENLSELDKFLRRGDDEFIQEELDSSDNTEEVYVFPDLNS